MKKEGIDMVVTKSLFREFMPGKENETEAEYKARMKAKREAFKRYNTLKKIAYVLMKAHNDKEYKKGGANKRFYTYKEQLAAVMKLSGAKKDSLVEEYNLKLEAKHNRELKEHEDSTIIIPKLKTVSDAEIEHIKLQLMELERTYDLQLDTNYNDNHAVLMSYQQVLAYKYYNIEIKRRPEVDVIEVGDECLLDAMAR